MSRLYFTDAEESFERRVSGNRPYQSDSFDF